MVKYECNICNYITVNKSDYVKHNQTKKHHKKVTIIDKNHIKKSDTYSHIFAESRCIPVHPSAPQCTEKSQNNKFSKSATNNSSVVISDIICEYCNMQFTRTSSMSRHKKICTHKNYTEQTYELKFKEMQSKIDLLEKDVVHKDEETNHYKEEMNYYKKMLMEAGGLVKKSVSALTYSVNNYADAPALQTITMKDIGDFKGTANKIVEDVLSAYKHKTLGVYLGDVILHICKKDDPATQSIWNTDDSRLTYLIKELFNNKSSNWIVDKKGIKTKTYLINPLLSHVKELITSYQYNLVIPELNLNSVELEFILDNNKKIIQLINDIDDGVVSKDILRHISSHLKFNSKVIE